MRRDLAGLLAAVSPFGAEIAIIWLAFVFLVAGASPAHFWLDSGEIAAAGAELGVMHPTGVPGYVPLLHAATLLPIGSLGFRMAVVSSACMAAAIGLLLAMLRRRGTAWTLLAIVGLWLPLALTLVRHGRVVEIYAFGGLCLLACLWGFDPAVDDERRTSRRLIGVFAAVVGVWGFGDLRLALLPAVLLAWVLGWRRSEPWARWAPLTVALASATVLTLPLASARAPVTDWGNPETLLATWDHVQARSIRESFSSRLDGMGWRAWSLELRLTVERLVEDLGPFGLLLATGALLFGVTRPLRARASTPESNHHEAETVASDPDTRLYAWIAWIVLVEIIYAVTINPMGGRDRQTGLALVLLAALVIGVAVQAWTRPRPRLRWALLPLLACALWLPSALVSLGDIAATRSWASHAWTREVLARTPRDALLLSQSDDLSAGLTAAKVLEGARPDVIHVPAQHLYRAPTERQLGSPRTARVWEAARGRSDRERIARVLERWPEPIALESPGSSVLDIEPLVGAGEPPLWLTGEATSAPNDPLAAAIARWRGQLDHAVDRERLADALALWIHGEFGRAPESPLRWLQAERGYRMILAEVLPDHPRSLIGLAAVRDRFGDTDEAIALTRRAIELDPERPTALSNLALYLSRDPSTHDEALELAELAVELAADLPSTWSRLLQVCRVREDPECIARAEAGLERFRSSGDP